VNDELLHSLFLSISNALWINIRDEGGGDDDN
jgi:hypothetical protein